jgi:hypothetical protein
MQAPFEQTWPEGHAVGLTQSVQPDASKVHWTKPPPEHCLVPAVHWF